jgi:hypothetical protein
MISQMTWLERRGAQLEAAALRRDINEAEAHIAGLQRRYVGQEIAASQHGRRDDGRWARAAWNAPPDPDRHSPRLNSSGLKWVR